MSNGARLLAAAFVLAVLAVGALFLVTRGRAGDGTLASAGIPERVAETTSRAAALEQGERARDTLPREAVRATVDERATSAGEATDAPADAATGSDVIVSVVGPDGAALADALTTMRWTHGGVYRERSAHEVAPGRFRFEALDPGLWTFTARMPGHVDGRLEIDVTGAGHELEVELALERREGVRIRLVTPSGEPFARSGAGLPPVDVIAARERAFELVDEVVDQQSRGACGRYDPIGDLERVRRGFSGTAKRTGAEEDQRRIGFLELACEPPLWVHAVVGKAVVAVQRLEPGVAELTFVLDPHELAGLRPTVSLTVVDESSGAPLPRVSVRLESGFGEQVTTATPGSGAVELRATPGPATLELELIGYEHARRELVLPRAARHDLGVIALRPVEAAELVIEVRRPADVNLLPVVFWAPCEAFAAAQARPRVEMRTLRQGDEIALPLGVGSFVVWCEASSGYGAPPQVVELGGGTRRVVLEIAAKHAVAFSAPNGPRRLRIVRAGSGLYVAGPATCGSEGTKLTLLPGDYRVEVSGDAGLARTLPLVVLNGPTAVELP